MTTFSANIATFTQSKLVFCYFTLNDNDLINCCGISCAQDQSTQWLKSVLAAIECVEVFVEIASRRYGSPVLKWILVFSVELIKYVSI